MAMLPLHDLLRGQAQITILSALAVAIFVVDERRRVLFANPAGSRLLQAGDALRIRQRTLVAVDHAADSRFHGAIVRAAGHGDLAAGERAALVVPRREGTRPLNVTVLPVGLPGAEAVRRAGVAAAVVFAKDTDAMQWSNLDFIAGAYGLTVTEKRFLAAILQSEGLAHAAEKLNISRSTASTHLQHIYAKTGTARQAELISLVASHLLPLEA